MDVDIGAALATEVDPGISETDLETLDEQVEEAHDQIAAGRADDRFGYTALSLPDRTDAGTIETAVSPVADAESVLTVGIGGSALGATTIATALGPSSVEHVALDNIDPEYVGEVLNRLNLGKTAVHVVSRSGTTVETLANFLVVREAMTAAGVDWTERTIVTTGDEGPLRRLAADHGLPTCTIPEGVPGRFAALSPVGLVPAAIQGHAIEDVLAGSRTAADSLAPSLFDCPAYAYGAISYGLVQEGATINAMMPYAERLEPFAEWFAQLWAESLGKAGQGQTPVRALGATDQHSQLQLYRAGPRDKQVTLLRPRERDELDIPEPSTPDLSYLGNHEMGAVLDAEFEATEASLVAAGRPTVRIEIDRLDARSLGKLLYEMEAACIMAGELFGVETFTQPAVEWSKRATRGLLGELDADEAAAVANKPSRRIE